MDQINNMIIIPHTGKGGGAFLYIEQFIKAVSTEFSVHVSGKYAREYSADVVDCYQNFPCISFPHYAGVPLVKTCFHLFSFKGWMKLFKLLALSANDSHEIIVFTSTIQILDFLFVKKTYPNKKYVLLVQENFIFDGFLLKRKLKNIFNKFDLVVSITDSWTCYAKNNGVYSLVFKNYYDGCQLLGNEVVSFEYDALYLGGEQKIKGFLDVLKFIECVGEKYPLKIAILGNVSKRNLDLLNTLAITHSDIHIDVLGEVVDPYVFFSNSKVLLLPIKAAHFCRPAIEAGLCNRTFLIRDHEGLDDFVYDDLNCSVYQTVQEMSEKFLRIVSDDNYRQCLELNNYKIALKFVDHGDKRASFLNAFKKILSDG